MSRNSTGKHLFAFVHGTEEQKRHSSARGTYPRGKICPAGKIMQVHPLLLTEWSPNLKKHTCGHKSWAGRANRGTDTRTQQRTDMLPHRPHSNSSALSVSSKPLVLVLIRLLPVSRKGSYTAFLVRRRRRRKIIYATTIPKLKQLGT